MENIVKIPARFEITDAGKIKANSAHNVFLALRHDDFTSSGLKYNEFTDDWEVVSPFSLGYTDFKRGEVPTHLESALTIHFEKELGIIFTNQAMKSGLEIFMNFNSYNPVQDYMENALNKWDGKDRISTLFHDYLGAENSKIVQKITTLFLVGAVKKVYQPDFKFDYVLDLVGGQGVGKTSILAKLGMKWYTDSITDFQNKDNYELMLRCLIVNDDEMVASKKCGFAELKAFITKRRLRFRKPYAKRSVEYAKKFILARTTNEVDYLKDKTGERRFLPVLVGVNPQKKHPMELTSEEVAQIWGQALAMYQKKYNLVLTKAEEDELAEYRERFMYKSELENKLDFYLDMLVPKHWGSMKLIEKQAYVENYNEGVRYGTEQINRVTTEEILQVLFNVEVTNQKIATKVKYFMDNLPEWEHARLKIKGTLRMGYKRKKGTV